jgi:RHS repeat-associated protein
VSNNADAPMRLSKDESFKKGPIQVLGINMDGPAGTLTPGAKGQIPFYVQVPTGSGISAIEFNVEKMKADSTAIDWTSIEADMRQDDMDEAAWNAVFSNFKAQMGETWATYLQALNEDAAYLGAYRRSEKTVLSGDELSVEKISDTSLYDVRSLLAFEFSKASAALTTRSSLASAGDAYTPAPGLPLVFGRSAFPSIPDRFRIGTLGRGWYHIYEYALEKAADGNVTVKGPGNSARLFQVTEKGGYQGLAGDFASLTVAGTEYVLREKDGVTWRFKDSGELSSIQDTNGNALTFSYSAEILTEIVHSNGDKITLTYNSSGRISQLTAPGNRIVKYRYDASGEYLTEVEQPGALITGYAYHASDGTPAAHALTDIIFPNSARYHYAYDEKGRLASEWPEGDTARLSYSYDDAGTVTVTDALNHNALIRFGLGGEVLEIQDANNITIANVYNSDALISGFTDLKGNSSAIAYDTKGNPVGIKNALNQLVKMSFDDNSRLTRLTDARSNVTQFTYNNTGNLKTAVYPDSTVESYDYDSSGNIGAYTNRRKQFIDYTVNNRGQISRKLYPDGRSVDYGYDSKGNLISAADSLTGAITLSYDERNFLTNIAYPGGYGFTFEYNNAGQRIKRTGHDGNVLAYAYDAAGRLEKLSDGAGKEIVRYEYDETGRLANEIKGNVTRTAYEYDAAGQLLSMINYSPGGVVQSRFDYTYDDSGNRSSMTTAEGTTRYTYDDIGQLTGVTYPDGKTEVYAYDAAGNRISVMQNGVSTAYTTNNMNQYAQVGGTTYLYDADGNMTSKSDASGTTKYGYDAENRLIRVETPSGGMYEYVYDALGNRISVKHGGDEKRYVHDPAGLVDIATEYDGSGALFARYIHAAGLVAKSDATGKQWFYAFDGIGHTRQLTDSAGAVVNSYDYSPFGVSLKADESVANPFRYVGRFGVMEEGNGLIFMRARYYSASAGRFVSQDPIGLNGGDANFYRYVQNDPINFLDPLGIWSWNLEHAYSFAEENAKISAERGSNMFLVAGVAIGFYLIKKPIGATIGSVVGKIAGYGWGYIIGYATGFVIGGFKDELDQFEQTIMEHGI